MNLILVESPLNKQKFPADDRRSIHIRKIGGKKLFVGIPNGPIGLANVEVLDGGEIAMNIEWKGQDPSRSSSNRSITLLVPYCRPQTCRKILRDAATLGIERLVFFSSGKAEAGYADSSLWKSLEWQQQLYQGVEQSFSTFVPTVHKMDVSLEDALVFVDGSFEFSSKLALDNYESAIPLGENEKPLGSVLLAVGPERGWSVNERKSLLNSGFTLAHMGPLVMRTETAVVAASGVLNTQLGAWQYDTKGFLDRLDQG